MRVLNTPHYRIHTDLEPQLAEDLASRMEAMYAEFSQRLADFGPDDDQRFEIYLFNKRQDYLRFVGDMPNTGGVFISRRNLLAAFLEGQGRDGLRRTLQHEAFHQFAFMAISPNLPVWLSEGLAQIFEEGIWTGRQFMIGQVSPRRIRQLQQDLREQRLMPFRQFLSLSDEQWQKDLADAPTSASRYCQAWAMAHFLIFAQDESNQPKYRGRLLNMLRLIHKGNDTSSAFSRSFSDNIEGFQQRFLEYAENLKPTAQATYIEHQCILADLLIALHEQGMRFNDIDQFRRTVTEGGYRLRYSRGQIQWTTSSDPSAYFRDTTGRFMTRQQLYFSPRGGAPLPDIVCRPLDGFQLRTIFHNAPARPDYETIVEMK